MLDQHVGQMSHNGPQTLTGPRFEAPVAAIPNADKKANLGSVEPQLRPLTVGHRVVQSLLSDGAQRSAEHV